jgi:hypothetical protein
VAGARWVLELRFGAGPKARTVRVTVAGGEVPYAVEAGGLDGTLQPLPRDPDRSPARRLTVRFSPHSLRVACDGFPRWYSLKQGPGGPLSAVRLKCEAAPGERRPAKGAVAWSAFALEEAVDELPRPAGDERRDELWLAEGDQVFGRVLSLDRGGVTLEARFGTRTFPWADLRGWFPRREPLRPRALKGDPVRVRLHAAAAEDGDLLDGVVTALDARTLTLAHALLGELRLDRRYVRQLWPRRAPVAP